jgi:hypothetical protein
MSSWWKSQLDFAEGLLEQVDKRVTSAVQATSKNVDEQAADQDPQRSDDGADGK